MADKSSWRIGVTPFTKFMAVVAIFLWTASGWAQSEVGRVSPTPAASSAQARKDFAEEKRKAIIKILKVAPGFNIAVEGPDATSYVWHASGFTMTSDVCKGTLNQPLTSKLHELGFTKFVCTDTYNNTFAYEVATKALVQSVVHTQPLYAQALTAQSQGSSSMESYTPLWETKLKVQETDFVEFITKDRVLVGSIDTNNYGGGPQPGEVILLNAATGETIWAAQRGSYGSLQALLAHSPVILLQGSKQYAALNPENGSTIWSRENAGPFVLQTPGGLLVLVNRKASKMSVSAVNVKTGGEIWKTPIANYPTDNKTSLNVILMGDAVLLDGPEVVALSVSDGKLLWRMPFPGPYGTDAGAFPAGDDLYLADSSAVIRANPASGKQMWRTAIADGGFQSLTADEHSVFVLQKASGENPPNSIVALDRASGKQLWKYELGDRAASPMRLAEGRLYVATPGNVFALEAASGSVLFKTEIPASLQWQGQLPDQLRITGDRIIVAREYGVLAVQKAGGKLLFADYASGTEGFTYSNALNRMLAFARTIGGSMKVDTQPIDSMLRQITPPSPNTPSLASPQGPYLSYGQAIGTSAATGGIEIAAVAINKTFQTRGLEFHQAEVAQTLRTHANSLQGKFYLRPCLDLSHGSYLHIVDLETGMHADMLNAFTANLPAFSMDGLRLVSKGISNDTKPVKQSHIVLIFKTSVMVTNSSIFAYDLGRVHFEPQSPSPNPPAADPEKK